MKRYILVLLTAIVVFSSCEDDFFSPALENHLSLEDAYNNPRYAEGLLHNGYERIPINGWSFNDVATDDAVTNDNDNNYRRMATGQWSSMNNPLNQWTNSRAAIQYLNSLLSIADSVTWAIHETPRLMFNDRIKGEAYALRALFMYYLLESHGGWTTDGQLLGIPIVLEAEDASSDFNRPRATFEECLQQIFADLDRAEELLPLDYEDIANISEVPEKYRNIGADRDDYNRTFGHYFRHRISGRIVKGMRAKVALLAASPAYTDGTSITWEDVANYAAEVIDLNGGLNGLAANGGTWFANHTEIDGLGEGVNPPEVLWRTNIARNNDLESEHFPPTLYGNGRVNPTQNLVDAFPMANGFPITDETSGYDPNDPYTNRDPRLTQYIVVNGSNAGVGNTTINTAVDGGTNDGLNRVATSTRTGYYMRKLLRQDVNLDPSTTTEQDRYKPRIRYTEIYLIYAEAANEAWGSNGAGGNAYSAMDVISAIRQRAGIGTDNNDSYLLSVSGDQADMRDLIRNERRLELCFEGFRFWDLRRWNKNLSANARGMSISGGNYTQISVENRVFDSYMNHGPIPFSEMLKYDALIQNAGWE